MLERYGDTGEPVAHFRKGAHNTKAKMFYSKSAGVKHVMSNY